MIDLFEGIATIKSVSFKNISNFIEMIDLFEGIATRRIRPYRNIPMYWNDWPVWRDCDISLRIFSIFLLLLKWLTCLKGLRHKIIKRIVNLHNAIEMIDLFEGIATRYSGSFDSVFLNWNDWPVWRDCD